MEGPPTERRSVPVRRGLSNVDDKWEDSLLLRKKGMVRDWGGGGT
jgi:hypothetical protein